jgi:hypothetical protein
VTRLVILRAVAGSTLANDVAAGVDSATARGMTWLELAARSSPQAPALPRGVVMPDFKNDLDGETGRHPIELALNFMSTVDVA